MTQGNNSSVLKWLVGAAFAVGTLFASNAALAQYSESYYGDNNSDARCANVPQLKRGARPVPKVIRFINGSSEPIKLSGGLKRGNSTLLPGASVDIQLWDNQGMVWDPKIRPRFRVRSTARDAVDNCYILLPKGSGADQAAKVEPKRRRISAQPKTEPKRRRFSAQPKPEPKRRRISAQPKSGPKGQRPNTVGSNPKKPGRQNDRPEKASGKRVPKPVLAALDPKNIQGNAYQPDKSRGCRATISAEFLLPLAPGQKLKPEQKYCSSNGDYVLRFQNDGNLLIYDAFTNNYKWGLDQNQEINLGDIKSAEFDKNGHLVLSNKDGAKVWAFPPNKPGKVGRLDVLPTGELALVDGVGNIIYPDQSKQLSTNAKAGETNSCEILKGFGYCLEMTSPKIKIHGSKKTTPQVVAAVARVYTEMFKRLAKTYPKDKFDGFDVYLTNGESMNELDALQGVNTFWDRKGRNQLRGGAGIRRLWISDQMICQKGVPTRNADYAAGRAKTGDNSWRSYDQVVHEMAHSIDGNYPGGRISKNNPAYKRVPSAVEVFAMDVQAIFGAPKRSIPKNRRKVLDALFTGGTAEFKCDGKKPQPLKQNASNNPESGSKVGSSKKPEIKLAKLPKHVDPPKQVAPSAPLPAMAKLSFEPSGTSKVLIGKSKEFRAKCAKSRDIAEADRIGNFGIVAGFYQNSCYTDGRYNSLNYKVEDGKFKSSLLPGTTFPSYKVYPPQKKYKNFLGSQHAMVYKFPERKDYAIYALIGETLNKVADIPAAEIVPGEFTKLSGVSISKLTEPITYVIAPKDAVISPLSPLSDGVSGAKIAKNSLGTWETYRYKVNGTPFDTVRGYTAGPDEHKNRYGQTRRFFPVHLSSQPGVIWQDQKNDKIYLQKLSSDLRTTKSVELPVRNGYKLAAATSDDNNTLYYLIVQRGGQKQNSPRGMFLYRASTTGVREAIKQLNAGKKGFNVSTFSDFVADMEYSDGKLGLMFARKFLRSRDGLQHQSGSAYVFDAKSLKEIKNHGQTSGHSFENVLMAAPGGQFFGIDLGDNYPRGVHLHRFDATKIEKQVVYTFKTLHGKKSRNPAGKPFSAYRQLGSGFYKWSNDNDTYTELGGVIATPDGFVSLFVGEPDAKGRAIRNERTGKKLNDARNVGLVKVGKNIGKNNSVLTRGVDEKGFFYGFNGGKQEQAHKGIVWLTKYRDPGRENASRLKAAGLANGNILLTWETWTGTNYVSTHAMTVTSGGARSDGPVELGSKFRLSRRGNPLTVDGTVLFFGGDAITNEVVVTAYKPAG